MITCILTYWQVQPLSKIAVVSHPATKLEFLKESSLNSLCSIILCQSLTKLHTQPLNWKFKVQNGCRRGHGKEGTVLESLCLLTSSVDELFYIEQWLYTAKVWHVGQSWAEATEHSKFMQDKIDPQHHLYSPAVLSRQHLEIYTDKLADPRGLRNHRNNFQSWLRWDDWVNCVTVRQTDRQTPFRLYIVYMYKL